MAKLYIWIILNLVFCSCGFNAKAFETISKQAILVDSVTGSVLFEKNADERMAPSSMSKIMTIYQLFGELKAGKIRLKDTFRVSEKAWRKKGSKMFVSVDSRVKVEDLIRGVIVQSGNDASIVVAEGLSGSEEAFSEELNETAKDLGMLNSKFTNSSGWPDPEHYTTARDLAKLAKATISDFPEFYHFYAQKTFTFNGIKQPNRNPTLYRNIGADGLKTGHTRAAGYGLTASAVRNDRRLILVINGLPNLKSRSTESERILDWGFRSFANYTLFEAEEVVAEAPIWMGEINTVSLVIERNLTLTLNKVERKYMKVSIVFDQPVPAPINKGDQIATLVVQIRGKETQRIPLVAGQEVKRLGFFGRLLPTIDYILWGEAG